MNERMKRIGAIVRTDALFRFRRMASIVTLLIAAASVYLIIPDLKTGRTLMDINNRRVVYNSAAVALGTSVFCGILLSLIGYYIVSNSLRKDITSRTAFVLAATSTTNTEFILGKFLGNVLYLTAVMFVCAASAMVMFLIRGETSLEPLVFLSTYICFVMPSIVFVSAAALAFESLPALSGRAGDVLFFFVWAASLGLPAALTENSVGPGILTCLDITGFVPMIQQLQERFHTTSMSIGSSTFDPKQTPILFDGILWNGAIIAERFSTLIPSGIILLLARFWFHRFNPTKIKSSTRQIKMNILSQLNARLKPVTRFVQRLSSATPNGKIKTSFSNAVKADVATSLMLSPLTLVAIVVCAILSFALPVESIREGLLPVIVILLVMGLADIVIRDRTSRTLSLVFTAPKLKANYVWWKYASALALTFCFTLIPFLRLMFSNSQSAISLIVGSCFISAGAVGLGMLSKSQKPFIAFFLLLLYITLNAKDEAMFDFAGFYGNATFGIQVGYLLIAVLLLVSAFAQHRIVLKRG